MKMKKRIAGAIMTLTLTAFAGAAHADYLFDWSFYSPTPDADPVNYGSKRLDITQSWYAFSENNHFFRIDLENAPEKGLVSLIRIDADYAEPSFQTDYLMVDIVLKNELLQAGNVPFESRLTGKTLEWKVTADHIGLDFTWFASATGSGGIDKTENAHVAATPIPGAVWLLGSGLVGLIGLRARGRKL